MTGNKVYTALSNNGPMTGDELPYDRITTAIREDGVHKFDPRARAEGSTKPGGGQTSAVYYIEGKHDPKTVIEKWVDVNADTVEEIGGWAIHSRICSYGDAWAEASRSVIDYTETMPTNNNPTDHMGGVCNFCGEEYDATLRQHLPCQGLDG